VDAADLAASAVEQMRADPIWRPVIASMPAHSWSSKHKDALEFQQYIADVHKSSKILSKLTARRLQICFSPLVRHSVCFASAYRMLCGMYVTAIVVQCGMLARVVTLYKYMSGIDLTSIALLLSTSLLLRMYDFTIFLGTISLQ